MHKDRFVKQLWISLGIIGVSIVAAAVAINYVSGDLTLQASAVMSARGTASQQNDALANLAALKSQAPQAAQYQAAINELLPDQYGLVTFPQWFVKLGNQYGVTAAATLQGVASPATGATPGTIPFSFSVVGSPSAVTDFLDVAAAKTPGFLFTINSFDVTTDGSNYTVNGKGTLFSR